LEGSARTRLHARLAVALEALGPPGRAGLAGELARHCALAVPMVEPAAALDVTRRAAAEATGRLAYEEAASHYAQAVRLASLAGNPVARRGLLLELAEAHLRAGEFGEARPLPGRRRRGARHRRCADAGERGAGGAPGRQPVLDDPCRQHRVAPGGLDGTGPRDGYPARAGMRARVLACLARDLVHGVGQDHARAVELSEQAVALARMLDDPATLALCLFAHHDALWVAGSATRRLPVVAEMATAAAAAGDPVLGLEARLARFVALLELGDPAAFVAFNEAARAAEELRQPHYQWMVGSRRAALALLAGRLGEAKRLIGEAVALAQRIGEPDGRNVAFAQRRELARLRGGAYGVLTALRAAISTSGGEWDEAVRQAVQTWVEVLEALIRLPDSGRAHDLAAVVRSRLEPSVARVIGWQQLEQRSGLAEVAAEAATVDAAAVADIAERTYQALLPSAASMVVVGGAVVCKDPVALHLGILAAALARWDQAVDHLRDAIGRAQRLGARPSLARGRELGRVLLARDQPGDRAQAEQLLRQATDAAGELGLRALAERAGAALAALVPPRQPSGPGPNVFRREGEVMLL
jgi:tetratricopeptide (TPR) repeat protein